MICKAGHYEPVAREGHIFIVPPVLLSFLLWWIGYPWVSLVLLTLACMVAMFFRNPERIPPTGTGIVISPCDGRVVEIVEQTESPHIPDASLKRMSIFMSIFNVHVNRWPVSGTVRKITHVPGRFLDARDPSASLANEHNSLVVESTDHSVEVVQIAGKIARRIACWVSEGDAVQQGDRFGLIRFGSRVDVYLPQDFSFVVPIGTKVRAGVTIIARKTDQ
jgi:phosphatidylserine decarboxylase